MSDHFGVEPYTEEWVPAVKALNARLGQGGLEKLLRFPESPVTLYPRQADGRLYQEYFLIAEQSGTVRGGFILTHEEWWIGGEPHWVAHLRLPLSEGVVDRRFKMVGPLVFEAAAEKQSMEYMLGMGGFDSAVARRLKSLGWSECEIPFYFKVLHGFRFLRNIQTLRKRKWLSLAADVAAYTGIGPLGIRGLQWIRMRARKPSEAALATLVGAFGAWADEIWVRNRERYHVIAPRDSGTLNMRYPAAEARYLRLRVERRGETIGWVVVLDTQMRQNKYFGDARVGSLVDGLAAPEDVGAVVGAATQFLANRGLDLVVCNHGDHRWGTALQQTGFLSGPSNYVFAASSKLAECLGPFEKRQNQLFLTRGDGAGPERLMA